MRKNPLIVGVDDRPGLIRLASSEGHRHLVSGTAMLANLVTAEKPSYVTAGAGYVVKSDIETADVGDLFSSRHRVLMHHALVDAGLGGQPIQLVTALPPVDYFSGRGGRENLTLIGAKVSSLDTVVRSTGPSTVASIRSSYVFAHGVNAWIDYALDGRGRVEHNLGSSAAVVEIGSASTFCTAVLPGYTADATRSGVVPLGFLDLLASISRAINRRFGLSDVTAHSIRMAAKTGFLEHDGKVFEIRTLIAPIQAEFASMLESHVVRRLGAPDEYYRMLFVGPGVELLPQLRLLSQNAETPEDPEYAGARGLVKYLQHLV